MINLSEFKDAINEENLKEMKKLGMPVEWAYKEYLELLEEHNDENTIDINEGLKIIINEYINGLLYRNCNKYELDWE